MPTNRLTQPKSLDDMLLYVLWQLQAAALTPAGEASRTVSSSTSR